MPKSSRLTCVLIVLALAIAAQGKETAVTTITPDKNVGQWRVEETSGRIFVSLPEDDAVVEYSPATGKEVRRFAVAGDPLELIVKGQWLVAGCTKSISLVVIDLKTDKVAGSIQLAGRGPYALFSSKADNAYAYGICNTGDAWWGGEVFQVDLAKLQVCKRAKVQGWQQSCPLHVAMSRDGKFIVPDARGAHSPSGGDLMAVDEEACEFRSLIHHHDSFGQAAADPSGRWWTLGNLLYPLDLRASVRKFTGSPVAIHPTLDLAASLKDTEIYAETFTQARFIGSLDLTTRVTKIEAPEPPEASTLSPEVAKRLTPADRAALEAKRRLETERKIAIQRARTAADRARMREQGHRDPTLQFDLPGNRVVCGLGPTAYVVAIADLGKVPPRLEIQGPSRVNVVMGDSRRIPLGAGDAQLTAKTTFEIASGPAFAKIDGAELVLSPTAKDLGRHDIAVKATRDKLSDSLTITATVGVPSAELPFIGLGVVADREGKYAVAWGPKKGIEQQHVPLAEERETAMTFAVIDLEGLKVTASRSVATGIRELAVDDKYLYMVMASGNLLYRLDRADLSQRKSIYLDGTPSDLIPLPDGNVAVRLGQDHQSSIQVFDRETLKRNPKHYGERMLDFGHSDEGQAIWEPLGGGLLRFCERVVDGQTGKVRCFLESYWLPRLVEVSGSGMRFPGRERPADRHWGRGVMGNTLTGANGSRIATLSGPGVLSPDYPLLVCLRSAQEENRQKSYIELRSLKLGEVVQSLEIDGREEGEGQRLRQHYGHGFGKALALVRDKVLMLDGGRLLVCPISAEVRKALAAPLSLKYPEIEIVSIEKPLTVQFEATGGEGTPTFSLVKEYEGLTIDAASGKAALDLPLLWKKHLAKFKDPSPRFPRDDMPGREQADGKSSFELLTGQHLPSGKMAFVLPIEVAVSDKSGDTDRLAVSVVVLAPADEIEKLVAQRQAEMKLAQERARQEMLRRQQEAESQRSSEAGGGRVEQLENRVRRLEATLDAVIEKLDRIERKQSPAKKE